MDNQKIPINSSLDLNNVQSLSFATNFLPDMDVMPFSMDCFGWYRSVQQGIDPGLILILSAACLCYYG